MSIPHNIKDWWRGTGPKAEKLTAWMNAVAKWLNLVEGTSPIRVDHTGPSIKISLEDGFAAIPTPPATGFYVLTSTDGTLAWKLIVNCEGTGAAP